MQNSNKTTINFLVWAETVEDGNALGKIIVGVEQTKDGFFSTEEGDVIVNVYLRGPKCQTVSHPENGVSDVLILNVSSDEGKVAASEYVSHRKGISQKYVVSNSDLTEYATSIDCTYHASIENGLVFHAKKTAINADTTLRKAFAVIDKDNNGYITVDELLSVSKDLGHELGSEEAKEIANTISQDSKISFDKFKHWWYAGRSDFVQFRQLVKMEFQMNSLLKKGAHVLKEFQEKQNQDGSGIQGRINIKPKVDFENGIHLDFKYVFGEQGKELISSLPDYFLSNVVTYTLELTLDNAENGTMLVSQLEGIKEMVFQLVPQADQMVSMGLNIKFRHVGTSVFVDFSLGGLLGDMINAQLGKFNLSTVGFSGFATLFVFSGIKLNAPLDTSYDDFVKMATQFKIETHGEVLGVKTLLELFSHFVTTNIPDNKRLKLLCQVLKILTSVRNYEYKCDYDSEEMCRLVKELAGRIGHNTLGGAPMEELNPEIGNQIIGGMVAGVQETSKGKLEGVKMMASQVLAPFLEALTALNFDKIGISMTLPLINLNYKITLGLVGLTEFLRNNIFN